MIITSVNSFDIPLCGTSWSFGAGQEETLCIVEFIS